jgi:hypothetical protein
MRLSLLISLSLLLLSWQPARAQLAPADDFFNSGAQFYISNNISAAKERVETGLKIYPDDVKLKKLEELLKQQQQSQNNQSQQNQRQSQSQQNSTGQQNSKTQQKPEEQKQDQSGQKNSEQQKQSEQQKSAAEKKNGEKPENQNADGQPVASVQMTPEEAKRLLDAQKGNEQVLQLKPKGSPHNSNRPFKDW